MNHAYFLTGTDTEIGKTFITCALLHRARRDGLRAAGLKPVAQPQPEAGVTYAHKLDKAEARLDWSQDAAALARRVPSRPGRWRSRSSGRPRRRRSGDAE